MPFPMTPLYLFKHNPAIATNRADMALILAWTIHESSWWSRLPVRAARRQAGPLCPQRMLARKAVAVHTDAWARIRCGQRNKRGRGAFMN